MTAESDGSPEPRFPDQSKRQETFPEITSNPAGDEISPSQSHPGRSASKLLGSLGERPQDTYVLSRFVIVRGVALVYLIAFFSLLLQIDGLFGLNGLLPISRFMEEVSGKYSVSDLPTVFWLCSSDSFLKGSCILGMLAALLAAFGVFSGPSLLICWALYLSFLKTGADFMSFQWDILLLEAGLLTALWAPWAMASAPLRSGRGTDGPPSLITLWLLRWLLFRLMFMSGMCKLLSGDEAWWNLTALSYHYETQPLPTPLAWFFNLLPLWVQKLSCLLTFGIEIVIPFLIFGNRPARRIAFGALAGLQVLILLSGNYTFFNFLSILLCFTLIDDSMWKRIFPASLSLSLETAATVTGSKRQTAQRHMVLPMVAIIGLANLLNLTAGTDAGQSFPPILRECMSGIRQLNLVNSYGLFAVMTQKRNEIILEGSNDGKDWKAYEFPFKPGGLGRMPPIVAPLQPRLDWQMWFAALGTAESNPWFITLVQKILEGDRAVTALLAENPFPDKPPRYLRAMTYEYHFTDAKELISTGNWWKRTCVGEYMPVAALRSPADQAPQF